MIQYEAGLQISLLPASREIVVALLTASGIDLTHLVEQETRSHRVLSFYFTDRRQARDAVKTFKSLKVRQARVYFKTHHQQDWESRWKKGWKPFPLTRRLHVVPLWQKARKIPAGKMPVYLDTTSAFGTGLHETTRFTAGIIESLAPEVISMLDVGTGTGILMMVALLNGVKKVVGFDIDPDAVKVARQNLKVNGLKAGLKTGDVRDFKAKEQFDLVAANLVSPDLVEFQRQILSFVRPGGYLVISGISLPNVMKVRRAFLVPGLSLEKLVRGKEWSAMLFKVASPRTK
jgi:ribosomal protein L11 methyltransferase